MPEQSFYRFGTLGYSPQKGVPWAVTLFVLFALILLPGIPSMLFLIPLWALFLFLAISYPTVVLSFIAFTHSFTGLIRWKEPDAFLLAGFGTILIVIFLVGLIIRGLLTHRFHIPLKQTNWGASKAMFLVWMLFVVLIVLNIIANWKGALSTLMMFREYIIPLFLFPLAVSVLSYRPRDCRVLLIALFLGSATVALINVLHYAFELPINIPRWVTHFDPSTGANTSLVEYRLVFGYMPLPRMKHILGLSGAGAGGVYFITMALGGYYLARHCPNRKWRWLLYLGSSLNIVAGFLSLSFSPIISFVSVSIYLFLAYLKRFKRNRAILRGIVVAPALVLLIFLLVQLSPQLPTGGSLIKYMGKGWEMVNVSTHTNFDKLLFGDGLGLKSGSAVGVADEASSDKYRLLTDQWIIVALYQLGVLGLFLSITFYALPLWMSVRAFSHFAGDGMDHLSITAAIIIAGFVGFMHGAAPIERLFSTPMMVAIAVIMVPARRYSQ